MANINIKKKDLFLISAIFVFLLGIGFVMAVWNPAANPQSHDSDNIKVTVAGTDYSLQEAVDSGLLGGGGSGGGGLAKDQKYLTVQTTSPGGGSCEDWTDVPGLSIDLNTNGGDVLIMFSGLASISGLSTIRIRMVVDGTEVVHTGLAGGYQGVSMQWLASGLAAGVHNFKVQYKGNDPPVAPCQETTIHRASFTAIEL